MRKGIISFLFIFCSLGAFAQDIVGDWNGALSVQGTKLHLVFHFKNDNGSYKGTLDSPDQSAKGIPLSSVSFKDSLVNAQITSMMIDYSGKWDGKTIKGTFKQAGMTLPLDLEAGEIVVNRPQEPKAPFPYKAEEVTFKNDKAGITFAGTLTYPKEKGTYPAVVLITGSGPQNRDEELFGHKSFLVIADYLTRHSIAVLRFDDRGTGKSGGAFQGATTTDFATDVQAAVNYLQGRTEINKKKIGLVGHSEGGIIAPIVASSDKNISFIVLLAGPGVSGDKIIIQQTKDLAGDSMPEAEKEKLVKVPADCFKILSQYPGESARAELEKYFKDNKDSVFAYQKVPVDHQQDYVNGMIKQFMDPWSRCFLSLDPVKYLTKVHCPVLALNGTKDRQVNADINLTEIRKALKIAGNKNFQTMSIIGLNHMFQECKTGMTTEYASIEQTFSPQALELIGKFISDVTK